MPFEAGSGVLVEMRRFLNSGKFGELKRLTALSPSKMLWKRTSEQYDSVSFGYTIEEILRFEAGKEGVPHVP